eukprot:scaffold16533_cov18-Tisochrysis_lutea.AAC.1
MLAAHRFGGVGDNLPWSGWRIGHEQGLDSHAFPSRLQGACLLPASSSFLFLFLTASVGHNGAIPGLNALARDKQTYQSRKQDFGKGGLLIAGGSGGIRALAREIASMSCVPPGWNSWCGGRWVLASRNRSVLHIA